MVGRFLRGGDFFKSFEEYTPLPYIVHAYVCNYHCYLVQSIMLQKNYVLQTIIFYFIHRDDLSLGTGESRTVKSLKSALANFKDAGAQHAKAKDYGNVVFESIIEGEGDDMVIDALPPPELHLLLGVMKLIVTGISLSVV